MGPWVEEGMAQVGGRLEEVALQWGPGGLALRGPEGGALQAPGAANSESFKQD